MEAHAGTQLINPAVLCEKAHIREGMHVADFGCGRTGQIVFPCVSAVGSDGVVYAVDIVKDVLSAIAGRAKERGVQEGLLHTVWADVARAGSVAIPQGSLDAVFFVNMLFQAEAAEAALDEAARLLKDKGRIIIADWARPLPGAGPLQADMLDFGDVERWARKAGFVVQDSGPHGQYHKYMVLYRHA